ncbi:MAG TPA: multicopper oxidase domain-containing protein [Gemmatimonadales bacterium]|nr:multicopper oxidase domain-containing protein [Gemmatimonadales bacterium]
MRQPILPAVLLLAAACSIERPAPPDTSGGAGTQARPPGRTAPADAPAEMSHGEAAVGPRLTRPDRTADAPPRATARRHRIRMVSAHVRHEVSAGAVYEAWTFDSIVPGPAIRVTVGDTVEFTLVNAAPIPHSMDFHAAEIAPSRAYTNVMPGDSISFTWVPRVPGAFLYHCGTAPVASHIANGMYGALIVDPSRARPTAREFVLVQSEVYMGAPHGPDSVRSMNWEEVLNLSPDHVMFNGVAARYATHPIPVATGRPIRLYVVNAGPNRNSAFHVVGGIFSAVYADGFGRPLQGLQTWDVPVGGGAIFELTLAEDGLYPFVSHAFADATKGAVGVFRAGKAKGTVAH